MEIDPTLEVYLADPISKGYVVQALHKYTDEEGNELWIKARLKNKETGDKWIRAFHKKDGKYVFGEGFEEKKKPLYNLLALKENPLDEIWIVEGEHIVDSLQRFGIVSTTAGGASSANSFDWTPVTDRSVVIWMDNDEAGLRFACQVTAILEAQECLIRWVNVDDLCLEEGEDFIDYWRAHKELTRADIEALPIINAPRIDPKTGLPVKERKLAIYSYEDFRGLELSERVRALPWLYERSLNMVYSWRGVGKTYFALGCAWALATGGTYLGWEANRQYRVMYIDGEMSSKVLQERLNSLELQGNGVLPGDNFALVPYELQDHMQGMLNLADPEGQYTLENIIKDYEVVIFDNLACLLRGEGKETETDTWLKAQPWLCKLRAIGKTVIFLHHAGKANTQRGTSTREDLLDESVFLDRPPHYDIKDGCVFEVSFEKPRNSYGEIVAPIVAKLINNPDGTQRWEVVKAEDNKKALAFKLLEEGNTQAIIAKELKVHQSTISRWIKVSGVKDKNEVFDWRANGVLSG